MDETFEILNDIYQNTKMGGESIETLLGMVEDGQMKRDLITQRQGYSSLNEKAMEQLMQKNQSPRPISMMTKMMTNSGVKMNTLIDKTPSHIAEMMIQGSTMGIIKATETIHKAQSVDDQARSLAEEVVQFEQNNIERMKEYL